VKSYVQLDEKPKKEEDIGWIDAKIAIVIGNIQVTVKELHIRYEDSVSLPSNPFVFGITLEEVCN
jgi:vacuolar protein sorting-associated protein 13A/C